MSDPGCTASTLTVATPTTPERQARDRIARYKEDRRRQLAAQFAEQRASPRPQGVEQPTPRRYIARNVAAAQPAEEQGTTDAAKSTRSPRVRASSGVDACAKPISSPRRVTSRERVRDTSSSSPTCSPRKAASSGGGASVRSRATPPRRKEGGVSPRRKEGGVSPARSDSVGSTGSLRRAAKEDKRRDSKGDVVVVRKTPARRGSDKEDREVVLPAVAAGERDKTSKRMSSLNLGLTHEPTAEPPAFEQDLSVRRRPRRGDVSSSEVPFKEVAVKEVAVKEVAVKEVAVKEVAVKEVAVKEVSGRRPSQELSAKEAEVRTSPRREAGRESSPKEVFASTRKLSAKEVSPPKDIALRRKLSAKDISPPKEVVVRRKVSAKEASPPKEIVLARKASSKEISPPPKEVVLTRKASSKEISPPPKEVVLARKASSKEISPPKEVVLTRKASSKEISPPKDVAVTRKTGSKESSPAKEVQVRATRDANRLKETSSPKEPSSPRHLVSKQPSSPKDLTSPRHVTTKEPSPPKEPSIPRLLIAKEPSSAKNSPSPRLQVAKETSPPKDSTSPRHVASKEPSPPKDSPSPRLLVAKQPPPPKERSFPRRLTPPKEPKLATALRISPPKERKLSSAKPLEGERPSALSDLPVIGFAAEPGMGELKGLETLEKSQIGMGRRDELKGLERLEKNQLSDKVEECNGERKEAERQDRVQYKEERNQVERHNDNHPTRGYSTERNQETKEEDRNETESREKSTEESKQKTESREKSSEESKHKPERQDRREPSVPESEPRPAEDRRPSTETKTPSPAPGPVSILKRKTSRDDGTSSAVTFSCSVPSQRPRPQRPHGPTTSILKKHASLDEEEAMRRRSCSPVGGGGGGVATDTRPILKRRSSLEELVRRAQSPESILKRRDEEAGEAQQAPPESILKRKVSCETPPLSSSHASLTDACPPGVDSDVATSTTPDPRPILKKASSDEYATAGSDNSSCEGGVASPRPILKQAVEDHFTQKTILKAARKSSREDRPEPRRDRRDSAGRYVEEGRYLSTRDADVEDVVKVARRRDGDLSKRRDVDLSKRRSLEGDVEASDWRRSSEEGEEEAPPLSVADRIRRMESALQGAVPKRRDNERYKTQPITRGDFHGLSPRDPLVQHPPTDPPQPPSPSSTQDPDPGMSSGPGSSAPSGLGSSAPSGLGSSAPSGVFDKMADHMRAMAEEAAARRRLRTGTGGRGVQRHRERGGVATVEGGGDKERHQTQPVTRGEVEQAAKLNESAQAQEDVSSSSARASREAWSEPGHVIGLRGILKPVTSGDDVSPTRGGVVRRKSILKAESVDFASADSSDDDQAEEGAVEGSSPRPDLSAILNDVADRRAPSPKRTASTTVADELERKLQSRKLVQDFNQSRLAANGRTTSTSSGPEEDDDDKAGSEAKTEPTRGAIDRLGVKERTTRNVVEERGSPRNRTEEDGKGRSSSRNETSEDVKERVLLRTKTEDRISPRTRAEEDMKERISPRNKSDEDVKERISSRNKSDDDVKERISSRNKSDEDLKERIPSRNKSDEDVKEQISSRNTPDDDVKERIPSRNKTSEELKERIASRAKREDTDDGAEDRVSPRERLTPRVSPREVGALRGLGEVGALRGLGEEVSSSADTTSEGESSGGREVKRISNEAVARRRQAALNAKQRNGSTGPANSAAICKSVSQSSLHRRAQLSVADDVTQPPGVGKMDLFSAGLQRSMTQPMEHVTHDDIKETSSIAQRLAALKKSQDTGWQKRLPKLKAEDDLAVISTNNLINKLSSPARSSDPVICLSAPELGLQDSSVLADRRGKLETAAQGWKKRVEPSDAVGFSVAGRMKDVETLASPVVSADRLKRTPRANRFRSKVASSSEAKSTPVSPLKELQASLRFTRSASAPDGDDDAGETSPTRVPVLRTDDETFTLFFSSFSSLSTSDLAQRLEGDVDNEFDDTELDLDAVGRGETLVVHKRTVRTHRRRVGSRNPLRALAARTDLCQAYTEVRTGVADKELRRLQLEKLSKGSNMAVEALAGLASKEDFTAVSLRKGCAPTGAMLPYRDLMLLHVKGRRHVQTRLVAPLAESVNSGDSFVLVTPNEVYNWVGTYSNVIERSRSAEIAQLIAQRKELNCASSAAVTLIEGKGASPRATEAFWALLGASPAPSAAPAGHPDEDELYEASVVDTNMVYEVVGNELVPVDEFWGAVPKIEMLDPAKVLVFDFGTECYAWCGKTASAADRRVGVALANELWRQGYDYTECDVCPVSAAAELGSRHSTSPGVKAGERPEWALLAKVTQHMETVLFREKFLDWPDFSRVIRGARHEGAGGREGDALDLRPVDARTMWATPLEEPDLQLEGSHLGRGTEYHDEETRRTFLVSTRDVSVWHIDESSRSQMPASASQLPASAIQLPASACQLHAGDSFVVRWLYSVTATVRELSGAPSKHQAPGRDRCAYFTWQGADASLTEQGAAALATVALDSERGAQVRLAQGAEPPAFLALFGGRLVVHAGRRADQRKGGWRLYSVRGEVPSEAVLVEVPCSMRQLRSRACLLLSHSVSGRLFLWLGSRSAAHARQVARQAAAHFRQATPPEAGFKVGAKATLVEVREGNEMNDFYEGVGGSNRQLYHCLLDSPATPAPRTPRLFHLSSLSGAFAAEEVGGAYRRGDVVNAFPFLQDELYAASQPALFLLDDGDELWLWQGWWPELEGIELQESSEATGSGSVRWQAERRAAMATALAYWRCSRGDQSQASISNTDQSQASISNTDQSQASSARARLVWAGLEPLAFSNLFPHWSDRDDVAAGNMADGRKPGEALDLEAELARLTRSTYPPAQLMQRPLPEGVDPTRLEVYLDPKHFPELLHMTKEEFEALPAWKQTKVKKEAGLF